MVRGEVGLVYCKAAQAVDSAIPAQHGNCQKDRAFRGVGQGQQWALSGSFTLNGDGGRFQILG